MNNKLKKVWNEKFMTKAGAMMLNPQVVLQKAQEAKERLNKDRIRSALGNSYDYLKTFVDLTMNYIKGDYRDIKKSSMVSVLAAILYFLFPMDLVPDFILGLGLVDDISVIIWVYNSLKEEIDQYKAWKESHV
jgi:uncharacterized membrane protein YkvA (DUF1232 family)